MEKKLYNPIMEWAWTNELCVAELIGYAAAFCGTVSLIPQIVKLWKERSAKAIFNLYPWSGAMVNLRHHD